jgi:hypothetical protein
LVPFHKRDISPTLNTEINKTIFNMGNKGGMKTKKRKTKKRKTNKTKTNKKRKTKNQVIISVFSGNNGEQG